MFSCLFGEKIFQHVLHIGFGAAAAARAGGADRQRGAGGGVTMAEVKEKHPTWFKMKIERRQLIKQLPAETAVNVLLACWDFLETGEIPETLTPIEKIAFSAFFPDMEEAWRRYEQRVTARSNSASTEIV